MNISITIIIMIIIIRCYLFMLGRIIGWKHGEGHKIELFCAVKVKYDEMLECFFGILPNASSNSNWHSKKSESMVRERMHEDDVIIFKQ